MSPKYHRFAIVVLCMTVILIKWGAATTTKQAGMAFADWPLSQGSVNPEGWLSHSIPFLEHSHRLIATLVGVLTLVLFGWAYIRNWRHWAEVVGVVLLLAVVFGIFIAGGAETQEASRKASLFQAGLIASVVPVGWLAFSWLKRGWPLEARLSGLALLMVTAQAIMGGIRVTEISDAWAVVHGCFAQAFFCVILLIVMVTSRKWNAPRSEVALGTRRRAIPLVLTIAVSGQLLLGALMRHHHRNGLADTGVFKTDGEWLPDFSAADPILIVMFFHKYWAWVIFAIAAVMLAAFPRRTPTFRRLAKSIFGLLVLQISLGILVILTGKNFWITNIHVLNGLAILALSFATSVRALRPKGEKSAAKVEEIPGTVSVSH